MYYVILSSCFCTVKNSINFNRYFIVYCNLIKFDIFSKTEKLKKKIIFSNTQNWEMWVENVFGYNVYYIPKRQGVF